MKTVAKLAFIGLVLALWSVGKAQANRPYYVVPMTEYDTFGMDTIAVPAGTTVVWPNQSGRFHSVNSDSAWFGPNSDLVFPYGYPGGYYFWWTVPFGTPPGTVVYYHCRFHGAPGNGMYFGSGMVGRIVVV